MCNSPIIVLFFTKHSSIGYKLAVSLNEVHADPQTFHREVRAPFSTRYLLPGITIHGQFSEIGAV